MEVTFNARHCTVSDGVREHASRRAGRLRKIESRPFQVDLSFREDHGAKRVEARLDVAGGGAHRASGQAPTFRTAVDRAVDRLERQVKRERSRRRARRSSTEPSA